jgi:aminopeptidase N
VPLLDPGVSRELASERRERLEDVQYELRLELTADLHAGIPGTVRVAFTLRDAESPLVLDFRPGANGGLSSCRVNGLAVEPSILSGHVVVPARALAPGRNEVTMAFVAGDGPLNRRDEYLYTIFVPARAHEAFPCFDQPDLKARWTLTLVLPDQWRAVANGAERAAIDETLEEHGSAAGSIVSFAPTGPLPTYLFAFAAGRFDEETFHTKPLSVRLFHRASDRDRFSANAPLIVDAHLDALQWLEDYTGIEYPFGKFDVVLVPDFQFGGMEHPGAIFYNQDALLLAPSATRQQLLARANVIAHETAHMWFGNLVTMPWFDDVWLKEVWANVMASKIAGRQFSDLDHELRFLHAHFPAAYDVDRSEGSNAIRQPLDNLADAGQLYGPIVYLKSPIVMRQLEMLLGEQSLRAALQEYLRRFAFGTASWPELLGILAQYTPHDLPRWSRDWIERPGRPRIDLELEEQNGALTRGTLRVRNTETTAATAPTWAQHVDVAIGAGGEISHRMVWLDGTTELGPVAAAAMPDFVLPAGRGVGYGEFHLDGHSRERLLRGLPTIADVLTRASGWLTLWDGMLTGDVAVDELFDLAKRLLWVEPSDLNRERLLADVRRLFWQFLAPDRRHRHAHALEERLRALLDRRSGAAAKGAIFAALLSITTTEDTLRWLRGVWSGADSVDGLPLAEPDRIAIAKTLALHGAEDVQAQQVDAVRDPERRAGLQFLIPALSSDPADRACAFERLCQPEHRRREPWVVEAMRWLHHPARGASAIPLIRPALARLEEVKQTGDIFLPKRWLDAMLGLHSAAAAAQAVRDFLASTPPEYPRTLRLMILSSADYLFRAAAK